MGGNCCEKQMVVCSKKKKYNIIFEKRIVLYEIKKLKIEINII
jgi:hypothetical protein